MNFNTTNSTFRQLMGNGLSYRVPMFQRDYSWGPMNGMTCGKTLSGCSARTRNLHTIGAIWYCNPPTTGNSTLSMVSSA